MTHSYRLLVGATSGAGVLALEVLAARTVAPQLGTGSVTWSALLAVALGVLAAGNMLGGKLGEDARQDTVIVAACTAALVFLVLLSQFHRPLDHVGSSPIETRHRVGSRSSPPRQLRNRGESFRATSQAPS